jgi:hypothetical protein
MGNVEIVFRNSMRTFKMITEFIKVIREGKTAIILSMEFVVMDRKSYDRIIIENIKKKRDRLIFIDECATISKEQFDAVMNRNKTKGGTK